MWPLLMPASHPSLLSLRRHSGVVQRVEGLGEYAGSGSRGVIGSLSTKVRT